MRVLSLFDGMSCGQIALKELNYPVEQYYASEIDKYAIAQTRFNFPDTIQLGDVTKWKEWDIDWNFDLVMGGSPCFVAGTKVICQDSIKNIEDVQVGDKVLTHNNRYCTVLRTGGEFKQTYGLKAQGIFPTFTTANHPYYIREMEWHGHIAHRCFSEPKWKPVNQIKHDDFIGIPIIKTSENPLGITPEEAFIIGRYIADGHTRKGFRTEKGREHSRMYGLVLSIGESKVEEFKSIVKARFNCRPHTDSTYRCIFCSKRLVEIVEEHCGCGAINKHFSKMLLDLPVDILERVIDGYISGDGSCKEGVYKCTTISMDLAYTLSLAVAKVYQVPCCVGYFERPKTCVIQGRTVNQHSTYTIGFSKEQRKQAQYKVIDGIIWTRTKGVVESGWNMVYNLEVEDDNSYTANGAIVHNCQGFSMAGKQLAFDDPRSKLFFVYVDILNHIKSVNPDVKFLLENVRMKKEHEAVISEYMGVKPVMINSALLSAQNRVRLYWSNIRVSNKGLFGECYTDIPQPQDNGILLRDILESEVEEKYYLSDTMLNRITFQDKGNGEIANLNKGGERGSVYDVTNKISCLAATDYKQPKQILQGVVNNYGVARYVEKSTCIDANYHNSMDNHAQRTMVVAQRGRDVNGAWEQQLEANNTGKTNTLTSVQKDNLVIQINPSLESGGVQPYQQNRVYDSNGISPALSTDSRPPAVLSGTLRTHNDGKGFREVKSGKGGTVPARAREDGSGQNVVSINSRIRRLTPLECSRLQTIPSWYLWHCSDTQAYKMLGNGWTVEVIKHILSYYN